MVIGAWAVVYAFTSTFGAEVLALDAPTVGLISAVLSFGGAVIVAVLQGRNLRGQHQSQAAVSPIIEALHESEQRAAEAERERDEALADVTRLRRERDRYRRLAASDPQRAAGAKPARPRKG